MAAGTLLVEQYFGLTPETAVLAATMGATTFSLFHIFAGLSCRSETQTAFSRDLLADRRQVVLYGLSLLLTILATELGFLQRVLGTQPLDGQQWLLCVVVAASVLVVDEVIKLVLRLRRGSAPAPAPAPASAPAPAPA